MNIAAALQQARAVLNIISTSIIVDSEILLAHVLKKDRTYLYTYPEKELTAEQNELFLALMAKRLQGIPIAYITGYKEFWSLDLMVNEHTLIPRPETELLVELVLQLISQAEAKILDLGTGSGAIALAIANERSNWHVTAVDYSAEALKIAAMNKQQLKLNNVILFQSDWFSTIVNTRYHAIVSNPPYIAKTDPHLSQGDVRFEPKTALISGDSGLFDIEKIISNAKNYLFPNGWLLLEHGFQQAEAVQALFKKYDYVNINSQSDLAANPRITYAQII